MDCLTHVLFFQGLQSAPLKILELKPAWCLDAALEQGPMLEQTPTAQSHLRNHQRWRSLHGTWRRFAPCINFVFQHQRYQGRCSWNRMLWEFNYKYVPGKPRHKLGMEKGGAFRNLESQVWWVVIFRTSAFHLLPLRRATRWIWCQSCLHHCCHGNVRLSQDVRSHIFLCVVIFQESNKFVSNWMRSASIKLTQPFWRSFHLQTNCSAMGSLNNSKIIANHKGSKYRAWVTDLAFLHFEVQDGEEFPLRSPGTVLESQGCRDGQGASVGSS